MNSAIGSTLLFGVVIAMTPWAIVIVLVLLSASRGPLIAWSYVLGWASAIAVIGAAIVFWLGALVSGESGTAGTVTLVLDVAAGVALLAYGVLRLLRRDETPPADRRGAPTPRWLGALEDMRPVSAFALGVFWLNYPFVILWGGDVLRANLSSTANVVLLSCFVLLGASAVAGITTFASLAPARATPLVEGLREWTTTHAGAIVNTLVLVVGVVLVGKGLYGLA